MAQAITDVKTFLEERQTGSGGAGGSFEKQEETLAQEEKKRLRVLETERKAVADAVNSTVKSAGMRLKKAMTMSLGSCRIS